MIVFGIGVQLAKPRDLDLFMQMLNHAITPSSPLSRDSGSHRNTGLHTATFLRLLFFCCCLFLILEKILETAPTVMVSPDERNKSEMWNTKFFVIHSLKHQHSCSYFITWTSRKRKRKKITLNRSLSATNPNQLYQAPFWVCTQCYFLVTPAATPP